MAALGRDLGGGAFAMMVSCSDESGTDFSGPTPYASVAGFVGPTEAWKCFARSWRHVLDDFGIQQFHTSAFHRKDKDSAYFGWTESRRISLIRRLVEAINQHNLRGFAIQASVREYQDLGNSEPLYLVLFDRVLTTLGDLMEEILPEEALWPCFGRTSSMESRARRLYAYRCAGDKRMKIHFYTDEPQFVSTSEQIGLEPADLLANVARHYVRGVADPELDTFFSIINLRQIAGYNRTIFSLMTVDEITESARHVKASANFNA
jgi:uncharacterized protein DUF3800